MKIAKGIVATKFPNGCINASKCPVPSLLPCSGHGDNCPFVHKIEGVAPTGISVFSPTTEIPPAWIVYCKHPNAGRNPVFDKKHVSNKVVNLYT